MKKSADNFEGAAHDSLIKTENSVDLLLEKLASFENTAEKICENIEALSQKLLSLEGEGKERAIYKTVMLSQIDMLYEIFMQSGIPQYAKDSLGERVTKMKKALTAGEEDDRA